MGVNVTDETKSAVRDRLLAILISQTVDILDRKIGQACDLDLGCRLALGFRSGPLDIMRGIGASEVARVMARSQKERPGLPQPRRPLDEYQNFLRYVLVDEIGGVKVITLRRPEALNALNDEVTDEILSVLQRFEGDAAVRGFVLTGYGPRSFCAGADIGRFPGMLGDAPAAAQYARDCARLLVHMDRMEKPVVAALNGMALGGGLEMALRCHGIVAMRGAMLQLPEILLGIVPGLGGVVVPYRRWPKAAAAFHDMICRAQRVPANTAHAWGMIDELVDDHASLLAAAVARVRALSDTPLRHRFADGPLAIDAPGEIELLAENGVRLSGEVVAIARRAIVAAAAAANLDAALEVGYRAFGESACTAAAREGIEAFLQRRPADFGKTG